MDLLNQSFRLDTVQFGQIGVQHDLLSTYDEDSGGNGFDGNGRMGFSHRLLEEGKNQSEIPNREYSTNIELSIKNCKSGINGSDIRRIKKQSQNLNTPFFLGGMRQGRTVGRERKIEATGETGERSSVSGSRWVPEGSAPK